jgi:predicted nucleotidyltransferase
MDQLMVRIGAISPDPNILKVILFGSFAEGRAVPGSDVDILIVLRRDSRRIMDRSPEFLEKFSGIGIGVDVFAYTVDELDNPLVKNAMASGKVLFERKRHQNG